MISTSFAVHRAILNYLAIPDSDKFHPAEFLFVVLAAVA